MGVPTYRCVELRRQGSERWRVRRPQRADRGHQVVRLLDDPHRGLDHEARVGGGRHLRCRHPLYRHPQRRRLLVWCRRTPATAVTTRATSGRASRAVGIASRALPLVEACYGPWARYSLTLAAVYSRPVGLYRAEMGRTPAHGSGSYTPTTSRTGSSHSACGAAPGVRASPDRVLKPPCSTSAA